MAGPDLGLACEAVRRQATACSAVTSVGRSCVAVVNERAKPEATESANGALKMHLRTSRRTNLHPAPQGLADAVPLLRL